MQYDWPGNVRELKNTLLYALTMANEKDGYILADKASFLGFAASGGAVG